MACYNPDNEPLVGDAVYQAYSPQKCGKITYIDKQNSTDPFYWTAVVKWLKKGTPTSIELIRQLRPYKGLLEDHERKAQKMRDVMTTIQAL